MEIQVQQLGIIVLVDTKLLNIAITIQLQELVQVTQFTHKALFVTTAQQLFQQPKTCHTHLAMKISISQQHIINGVLLQKHSKLLVQFVQQLE